MTVLTGTSHAAEYDVDKSAKNIARFVSSLKFDTFEGITDKIDGYVKWDGTQPVDETLSSANNELYFEVLLASLDTGIGLRNRHMRENCLETDKYPYASYKAHITKVEKQSDGSFAITAEGKFTIHGVEKPMTITGTVTQENNGYHVKSDFVVRLTDHNIEVPTLMFLKINENIKVSVDFFVKGVSTTGGK